MIAGKSAFGNRVWLIYADFAQVLIREAQCLYKQDNDFEHSLNRTLFEFNLILSTLNESNLAVKLASESYQIKIKQYGIGQVTLQELNQTYSNLLSAKENYLNSLSRYWEKYDEIQSLALFDLKGNVKLATDFDCIIEQFYR